MASQRARSTARRLLPAAALALALACRSGPTPAPDHSPVITSFVVSATTPAIGEAVAVAAAAFDADGDALAFAWTAEPAGCGTFALPAAAATTFTAAVAGSCTVRATVTARGKSDSRSAAVTVPGGCGDVQVDPLNCGSCGNVCPSGACGAGACVDVRTAIDPLPQPPNGRNLWPSDTGARPTLLADRTPGGRGDLLGLVYAGDGTAGDAWYLLLSTDGGATFSYVEASNPEPTPDPERRRPGVGSGVAQDSVGWRVHAAWAPQGDRQARVHRIALAHGADGHVSAWSWEAENAPGPTFSTAGAWDGTAKLGLAEVVDGNGGHVLVLGAMDQPTAQGADACIQRLLACRTAAGTRALAPAVEADWVRLTDGGPGCDVIAGYSTGAADSCGSPTPLLALTAQSAQWMYEHAADFTFAQLPADRSLHFFDGPMYYVDGWVGPNPPGEIRRWRFVPSGAGWSLDASSSGAIVAEGDASTRACLGSTHATPSHVWLVYGSPTGLHLDRIGAYGAWTHDAVPQPDATVHAWWWTAVSVSPDESRVYAAWESWDPDHLSPPYRERSGYWDGATWKIEDDSASFARYGPFAGSTSWTPVALGAGIGVLAYGYQDWNRPRQHYHVHTLR